MRLHPYGFASLMLFTLQGFLIPFGSTLAAQEVAGTSFDRFVLPNGLTIIVHENHRLPLAQVRMFYHVAEKDAGPGQTAYAHLFEHLAFSRTENLDQSIWSFLKAIGARDYDANSQYDYTHFYETIPIAALDTVLWMEAQRMAHLANGLTKRDLERSRKEVFQEEQRLLQVPAVRILKETWDHTYPKGHPYAGFNIASQDIRSASLLDAQRFYERYYRPANAVLVIAGDVNPASVRVSAEARFASIAAGSPRVRSEPRVARRSKTERRRVKGVLPVTQIRLVWNTPGWGTAAANYLELATTILTMRMRARMRGSALAKEVSGGTEMRELGGQVMLDMVASSPNDFPQIERVVGEEIGRLASHGPTRAELERAKEEYAGHLRQDAADLAGVTLLLGIGELLWRDPGHFKVVLERANSATPEDVLAAVAAWLLAGAFVIEFTSAPQVMGTANARTMR